MIIVCNGGYRTGSTLAYNICRLVASRAGLMVNALGCSHDHLVELCLGHFGFWVAKSHFFVPLQCLPHLRIVYTCRRPLAVAASLKLWKPHQDDDWIVSELRRQRAMTEYLSDCQDTLVIPYDQLVSNMEVTIKDIAAHMGIGIGEDQVVRIKDELAVVRIKELSQAIPPGRHDPITQFRHNHIQDGGDDYWRKILSPALVERINEL